MRKPWGETPSVREQALQINHSFILAYLIFLLSCFQC
jgi:hypothetical protein